MMNTIKIRPFLILYLLVLLVLVACQPAAEVAPATDAAPEEAAEVGGPVVDLANPAALYCEGLGYKLEPRENAAGMDAACIFPDGNECGQWDFLSGSCGQQYSYCHQQGGFRLEQGANIGSCIFSDGSICDESMFFSGECRQGDNPEVVNEAVDESAEKENAQDEGAENDSADQSNIVPVVGWMGYVVGTEFGAQFDDYVVVLPEGEVGEFGIEGTTDALNAQIVALRDRQEPGKFAHFWGSLHCDVMDYGGCQLLVDRLRVDGPGDFFEADPVNGWQGKIVALEYDEPGAPQPDDAFVPAGDFPVKYGLDSAVSAESGELELAGVIITLRGSDVEIKIWGQLMCGVPDAGGCQITIYRIEAGDEVYEITPAALR
jgi:putative hemolysin